MFNWFSEESKILSIEILVHQMSCRSQEKKHEAAEKYKLQFVLIQEKNGKFKNRMPIYMQKSGSIILQRQWLAADGTVPASKIAAEVN